MDIRYSIGLVVYPNTIFKGGAAYWYHHKHKAPSQAIQDPPRRRASMTMPP